ncbi:MAG: HD domain-containing protein [Candidatus Krumholzibacteriota bacterium]|nr:HD domain-containing protein [Candidatus Krumholzibacteriota bacterium]
MNGEPGRFLGRELHAWERAVLGEGGLFLVGGAVRDHLIGEAGRSIDDDYVVTALPLDRLLDILSRYGSVDLVGRTFGVVKFTPAAGSTVDVSLPRREVSTGTGHRDFDVDFDPSIPIEEDLLRRDFTINSMAVHLGEHRFVDPLGGRTDIAARRLRVNRQKSFVEDPLRILRGVQMLARFDLEATTETIKQMRRDAALLSAVAPERIRMELDKMMIRAASPSAGFFFMQEAGLLSGVLPELAATVGVTQNEYHIDDVFTHSLKTCDGVGHDLVLRWAALLHDLGKPPMRREVEGRVVFWGHEAESARLAGDVLERLRYPGGILSRVVHLVACHMFDITDEWSDAAVRRFIARVGEVYIDDLFSLAAADLASRDDGEGLRRLKETRCRIDRLIEGRAAFTRSALAVDGRDVMRVLGVKGGPVVGRVLDRLLEIVLEDPRKNTRPILLDELAGMAETGERKEH